MEAVQAPGVAPLVASKSKLESAELESSGRWRRRTSGGQRCLSRPLGVDFHFASQYLAIAHSPEPSDTGRPRPAARHYWCGRINAALEARLLAPQTVPMASGLTSCSVRLQSWPAPDCTGPPCGRPAELAPDSTAKRLRGSDSFAN